MNPFMLISFVITCIFQTSCTLSFTNISTHGTANDLVDETQSAKADVKPDISIPSPI